jgi:hypothetical protein
MAIAWDDAKLNWIVPARRAVVRKKIGYADAAEAWAAQLEHYKDQMRRWYGGAAGSKQDGRAEDDGFKFDRAVTALRDWIQHSVRERAVDAARDKPATLNLTDEPFYPRLWKGPLRVVHEEAGLDGAPQLDAKNVVTNPDAVFRMGDVLEFPLQKLLVKCGKRDYEDVEFDPEGSFLLSTSVKGGSSDKTPLHDNAAAMRLQLMVCLGKGAFYSPDPTWKGTLTEPPMPAGKDDGHAVYARGMPYCGTLVSPGSHSKGWKVQNYHWGENNHGTSNVPFSRTGFGYPLFPEDQPLTPGWVCSPFTLFISQYLLGARGLKTHNHYPPGFLLFDGGVRTTYTEHKKLNLPIHQHYEYVDWKRLVEDPALTAQVAETTQTVDTLRERLQEAVDDLSGAKLLAGSGVSEETAKRLEKYASGKKADPKALSGAVAVLVESEAGSKHAAPEADKPLLRSFHQQWMQRVVAFPTGAWPTLKGDGGWASIGKHAPKVATQGWPKPCPDDGCSRDHAGMKKVRDALKLLKKELAALPESGDDAKGFGGRSALHADFSEALGDVNVIILNGHEYAILKVWPFEDLAKETSLPRTAGLAGYDPLTGEPFTTPTAVPKNGQLFLMDATGTYFTWQIDKHNKRQTFKALPWRATPINGNRMVLSYIKTSANVKALTLKKTKSIWIGEYRQGKAHLRSNKALDAILRLRAGGDETLGRAFLRSSTYADLKWHKIYHILTKGKHGNAEPPDTDRWYAERAVPFATLADVADGYPTVAEAQKIADALAAEAYAKADPKPKTPKSTHAWAWYASNMENPNKDKPKDGDAGDAAPPDPDQPADSPEADPAASP